jgi:hypothetical protein
MNHPASTNLWTILKRGAGRAVQWRPLLLLVLISWVPTALLAVPIWRVIAEQLDNSVHAAQWAQHMDVVMIADVLNGLGLNGNALIGSAFAAGLAVLILLPFQNALLVSAARTDERLRLGALLHAGLREYGPMLRLLLVSLIPLGIAGVLSALAFKGLHKYSEHAILASDVDHISWLVQVVAGLLLIFALAGVEAGRARFAYDPRKRSAFKAWWRGFKLVLFYPLRSFGIFLGITLVALFVAAALSFLRAELPTASILGVLAGWGIVQVLAAVLIWAHFARISAYYELTRAVQELSATPARPGVE